MKIVNFRARKRPLYFTRNNDVEIILIHKQRLFPTSLAGNNLCTIHL